MYLRHTQITRNVQTLIYYVGTAGRLLLNYNVPEASVMIFCGRIPRQDRTGMFTIDVELTSIPYIRIVVEFKIPSGPTDGV